MLRHYDFGSCAPHLDTVGDGWALARCPQCGAWFELHTWCFRDVLAHEHQMWTNRLTEDVLRERLASAPRSPEHAPRLAVYQEILDDRGP